MQLYWSLYAIVLFVALIHVLLLQLTNYLAGQQAIIDICFQQAESNLALQTITQKSSHSYITMHQIHSQMFLSCPILLCFDCSTVFLSAAMQLLFFAVHNLVTAYIPFEYISPYQLTSLSGLSECMMLIGNICIWSLVYNT